MTYLILKTSYSHILYKDGQLLTSIDNNSIDKKYSIIPSPTKTMREASYLLDTINVSDIEDNFLKFIGKFNNPKLEYCWQVDRYLINLLEENNTVTIKAFTKVEDVWLSSNINNANFLADIWDSLWSSKILAACWYAQQSLENGSCYWDLTDTTITVNKLFKELYEYTDWVVKLNKDRQSGEWKIIHDN